MRGTMNWGLWERAGSATVADVERQGALRQSTNQLADTMSKHTIRQLLAVLGGILGAGLFWLFIAVLFSF